MNCYPTTARLKRSAGYFRRCSLAFTLIEMLVVITIIAVMAAIGIPHLKGWGEADSMTAATRQLMDDLSLARLKAINNRTTVYVVFVPPSIVKSGFFKTMDDQLSATNLITGQYTTYALYSERQVGDQPGRGTTNYLTSWKTLPDKVFIATAKFIPLRKGVSRFNSSLSDTNRPFGYYWIRFPRGTNNVLNDLGTGVPCVAFNSQGQLISEDENPTGTHRYHDAVIPLASGSIFFPRDANGNPSNQLADVVETPPNNSVSNYNQIRIDWLTGRARVERKEMQ